MAISEAVSDSNEELYLVVCRFYPCIAKSNSYRVKNACAITSNRSRPTLMHEASIIFNLYYLNEECVH